MSLAASDTDGAATPAFKELVEQSKKVSNTLHPCVFSIRKEDPKYFKEGSVEKEGGARLDPDAEDGDGPGVAGGKWQVEA